MSYCQNFESSQVKRVLKWFFLVPSDLSLGRCDVTSKGSSTSFCSHHQPPQPPQKKRWGGGKEGLKTLYQTWGFKHAWEWQTPLRNWQKTKTNKNKLKILHRISGSSDSFSKPRWRTSIQDQCFPKARGPGRSLRSLGREIQIQYHTSPYSPGATIEETFGIRGNGSHMCLQSWAAQEK